MSAKRRGKNSPAYAKGEGNTSHYTARMSLDALAPPDEQKEKESGAVRNEHAGEGDALGNAPLNEPAICPVCSTPSPNLSPDPCPGCGKHFCLCCRAQVKDDRCYLCYSPTTEQHREDEEGPPDEQHYPAGKAPSVLPSKPGEESATAPPPSITELKLPPISDLEFGELKFVPPGEKRFPPLDFEQGQRYQESMRQTDFGDTAVKQIAKLAVFFKKKLPGEQQAGESVVDAAIRLLGHYTHEG